MKSFEEKKRIKSNLLLKCMSEEVIELYVWP